VERPLRRHRFSGWPRFALAPLAAVGTAAVLVVATIPAVAVAAPSPAAAAQAATASVAERHIAGAGTVVGQLTNVPAFGARDRLRVTVLGDSVAAAAEPAIAASLEATGQVRVDNATIDGFGLSTDPIWRTSLPQIVRSQEAQVVVATWSWDDSCTVRRPTPLAARTTDVCALQHPQAYATLLAEAVHTMLEAGASGVVFLQFPTTAPKRHQAAGQRAWDRAARSMAERFPGQVVYLPVARSLRREGKFATWLPPAAHPSAPRSAWLRVRTVDGVHLCPAGAARYAKAVLTDLETALQLPDTTGATWAGGQWSAAPVYNTPPGACPADSP
jgi:hypothetical protein